MILLLHPCTSNSGWCTSCGTPTTVWEAMVYFIRSFSDNLFLPSLYIYIRLVGLLLLCCNCPIHIFPYYSCSFLHLLFFCSCFCIYTWTFAMLMQVEFESALEHPFFVFDQGWASCYPERTLQCYGLKCHRLQVGDVCICLTPRTKSTKKAENSRKRRWSAPDQFCNDDEEEASASMKRAKDWASWRYLNAMFLCDVTFQCAGKLSSSEGMETNGGCTYWASGL